MSKVTWLHISDLHFKSGKAFEEFNRNTVLKALWRDIKKQIASGLKPDFVLFSGDVTYHGKEEEYKLAWKKFFKPLLDATELSIDRVFVVPGNHDVDWGKIDFVLATGMQNLRMDRNQANQFLSAEQDRTHAFGKFHAYAEFINTYFSGTLTFSEIEYFYTRRIEIDGHTLAILGLNSAWMSACMKDSGGNVLDQGNLLIGERQLEEALGESEKPEKPDLRIALFHHPLDWLHETDRFHIEKRLNANCDFVLHGHWHIPQVKVQSSLAGSAVYIPAGAVYASRDYLNGYNLVQLDLDSWQGKVYLRRYNDDGPAGPEWIKDIQSTGGDRDGMVDFGFSGAPQTSGKRSVEVHDITAIRGKIDQWFNVDELRLLCLDLRVEYNDLLGDTKETKAGELLWRFERRGEMGLLLSMLKKHRPHVSW
jgi:predicted phosphodiesterase